jgi:cytochrome oxidase Cu insertion factor (SCO1/SenC/PrrC family)
MRARTIRNRSLYTRPVHTLLFGAALAAGLCTQIHAQNQQPPKTHLKEGDMAPDFTLTATTGGKVKLSDFRGKSNVVLAFFPAAFTGG